MLIDCGEAEYADKVADYLRSQGVKRLDYVAATHPHSDHMGGMYKILEEFPADSVIMPHIDDEDIPTTRFFSRFLDVCAEKDILIKEAQVGEILSIGSASAEIVAPLSEKYSDMNDYSLGIFIRHGKKSFLLTGDAEIPSESEMAESGRLSHADVFKAGHHGSNSSSSYKLLNVITPDHVVISCGKDNSYGHPDEAAVERLSQFTDNIYRTDICGNIIFVSDGENLTVRTERNTNDGDRQI